MPSSDSSHETLLERLAEEFVQRYRHGERPPLSEYADRYPDLAGEIRDLFPALVRIESLKPVAGDLTGAFVPENRPDDGGPNPERLGDYRILREVGHGGMGVVYEAEQVSLGRHVALKVLPRQALLKATYLERFRREAKAAARLHHTNIVPVFGVGECEGTHYYAMQFIRGEGLDKVLGDLRRLRAAPKTPPGATDSADGSVAQSLLTGRFAAPPAPSTEGPAAQLTPSAHPASAEGLSAGGSESDYYRGIARVGLQVADALAYAHRQGILHRDIKPSNLLLDLQGTVWITDFGLAKAEGADDLTQTGDIVGTVRFMAPERFDGRSLPQSDVYALGLTLYELLTLRPAFDGTNKARLVEQVLNEPPLPPRKLDPRIPRDLETVVLKCLAKDPAERYANAEALAEDLRRFLADRPILARRSTWRERTWRWCRRNPVVASLSTAVLLLLTLTAVGGVVMSLRLEDAREKADQERDLARQAEQERKRQLFESLVSEARAQRFSGRLGQRFGTLDSIRKAAGLARELGLPASTFDDLRNQAIAALALPDLHLVKEWEGWPEGTRSLVFDDTLERYARLDDAGTLTVRRVADDTEIARRTGVKYGVGLGGFDEGGRALTLLDIGAKTRERWRFASGESDAPGGRAALSEGDNSTIVTADHALLVTINWKTLLVGVYDFETGRHLRNIAFVDKPVGLVADGQFFWAMHPWRHELAIGLADYSHAEDRLIRVLDLDKGVVQTTLPDPQLDARTQVAWLPDGRTLAAGYWWGVVLWDVPTGRRIEPGFEHKGGWGAFGVGVSRSGQLLSTNPAWGGGVRFWHPYTRKPLLFAPGMDFQPSTPTADGRMYTQQHEGTRVRLWATEPSPVLRVLVRNPVRGTFGPRQGYRRCSVRRDGRLLAVGSDDGVSFFDLVNGLDAGHLDIGSALNVEFDPATGDLLTLGRLGLQRWPVEVDPKDPRHLRLGPPRLLLNTSTPDSFDFHISRDGRTIVVAQWSRLAVLNAASPDRPVFLEPTENLRQQFSVSPDGKWVAAGSHGADDPAVRVWETASGRCVRSQPFNKVGCLPQFTPDGGRLLVATLAGGRFWSTDDWRELPTEVVGGSDAGWSGTGPLPEFTPDGRYLVWESGAGALRLVSTATGREVVRLECPDQGRCGYTTFTPDGRLLVTVNKDDNAVHVWDLRELRRQLAGMDLDWDAPPVPPTANEPPLPLLPPLAVETPPSMKDRAEKRRVADQRNTEAWHLLTGPASRWDPPRALTLVELSVRDCPDEPLYLNTLGVAQYRNKRYREAIATLEASLKAGNGASDAFDLYFLAMCHARLGEPAKAKDCFDRAVAWAQAHPNVGFDHRAELADFRSEAEQVLAAP